MKRYGTLLALTVMAGFAAFGPATPAKATLEMQVFVNGVQVNGTFVDNGAGDTNPLIGQMDITGVVNLLVTQFQFTLLGASSTNVPVGATDANLTQTANVQTRTGFSTGGTVDILATDTDYLLPPNPTSMISSAAITTSNAAGVTRTFESWYNPNNTAFAQQVPAPLITQTPGATDSHSDTTSTAISGVIPFGFTNLTHFNIPSGTGHNIQTTGTTIAAVPEPSTIAVALTGLPLLALGAWRKRRQATA